MKVGIIGVGAVGAATAMAIALRARARDLILIDRDPARAKAVAIDMHYGVPLSPLVTIAEGNYEDLAGAHVAIIAAGVNEKAGGATDRNDPKGRLRLLAPNVKVFEDIVPRLTRAAPEAVILVATDPPEPLVEVTRRLAGHERVLSTSTYLDSLRFRVHLAERLGVSPACVDAYVVGEHGTSSVFLWSSARVGGMRVQDLLGERRIAFEEFRQAVEHDVRYANITIIEGIGASQYGIGGRRTRRRGGSAGRTGGFSGRLAQPALRRHTVAAECGRARRRQRGAVAGNVARRGSRLGAKRGHIEKRSCPIRRLNGEPPAHTAGAKPTTVVEVPIAHAVVERIERSERGCRSPAFRARGVRSCWVSLPRAPPRNPGQARLRLRRRPETLSYDD
jgi:L-lactate dehydrogenase